MSLKTIRFVNNLTDKAQKTYLASSYAVGGTALPVRNVNGFGASYGIQIGDTGQETAEIKILGTATPSGTTLNTTGTTLYAHPADTPVYSIYYDKVIFKRSTDGTAGTATAMSGGTITITPDSEYTSFNDTSGADNYAYRVSLYNSVTTAESPNSDWITPTGFAFYSLAGIRGRIKEKLFSANYIQSDDAITNWINEWLESMTNTAINVNKDYLLGTADYAHGTDGLATITSTSFKELRRVWYTTNGTDFYRATRMDITGFYPNETFNDTNPYFYYQGDNVIGKKPDGTSGTARIVYYSMPTVLSNDTDQLPVSMRSYTKSFVDYALAQAYFLDSKADMGDRFISMAQGEKANFEVEIAPRAKTGPSYIDLVETIDADEHMEFF